MPRVLLRLRKGEEVKYLSHLDVIRAFELALRRAQIPVAYSSGFNPRPRMSFGSAVGVGVTSDDERILLELASPLDPHEAKDKLNSQLPKGLEVLEAADAADAAGRPDASRFRITVAGDPLTVSTAIRKLLESAEVRVARMRKGETKEVDMRPHLLEAGVVEAKEGSVVIDVSLRSGDSGGAGPQDFVQALRERAPNISVKRIHRLKQFRASGR